LNIEKLNLKALDYSLLPFISSILIIALVALLNIPIMATLWRYSFDDGTYSHAYIVPFIIGYLFYFLTTSHQLHLRNKFSWLATVIFLFSSYILFVATTAQISLLYWLATILLICAAINLTFASNFKVFFPALYFIFLIPVWGMLTTSLQSLSVTAVNALMNFTSIPVFVEQQFVHIPSGVFEIAGGCSGLRYLITSLAISSLFSFLYLRTVKNTAIFVSVAIFGALLTNWFRIAALIIIGHQTKMTSSLMEDHNMFGWYLYIPFMLLLFKLGGYLSDQEAITKKTTKNIRTKNLINWKILGILLVGLSLSSTSLQMMKRTESKPEQIKLFTQPLIYNYSSIEILASNTSETYLVYNFKGDTLEGKPTFFDNKLIPDGWHMLNKSVSNDSQTLTIQNGLNTAVVTVSYEIVGIKRGFSSSFKLERLKQALIGINKTKLHWHFQLN